jgi:mono/diheme cytochrome c family protein
MSDADLAAIATYLKTLPPRGADKGVRPPSQSAMRAGQAIYVDSCAACHGQNGEGQPRLFPQLAGDTAVQAKDPTTTLRIILEGSRSVPTPAQPSAPAMPMFADKLTDEEVASVATYVRNAWGNVAPEVSTGSAAKMRQKVMTRSNLPR